MTALIDRLRFVAAQLEKMEANGWIRYEGNQVFQEGKAELLDTIKTYVEPVTNPAPIVLQAMTAEQVSQMIAAIPPAVDVGAILTGVQAQIEASDVAVMGAIAQSQSDVITALTPQPAAA